MEGRSLGVAMGLLGPLGGVAFANALVLGVTRRACHWRLAELAPAMAAIVPGARVFPGDRPSVPLLERLLAAEEVLAAGLVPRVLVSGARRAHGYDEGRAMRAFLRERGVPDDRIVVDDQGLRTLLTMRHARERFGAGSVIICTQAFHLPRAVFLAQRLGLDAQGYEANRRLDPFALQNATREVAARARAVLETSTRSRPTPARADR